MNKKIITIVSIVLALVFIGILLGLFAVVDIIGETSINQAEGINKNILNSELEPYNNTLVSGDTVIATINKLKELSDGTKMSYLVCTNKTYATVTGGTSYWKKYGVQGLSKNTSAITSNTKVKVSGAYSTITSISASSTDATSYVTYTGTSDVVVTANYRSNIVYYNNRPVGIIFVKQ